MKATQRTCGTCKRPIIVCPHGDRCSWSGWIHDGKIPERGGSHLCGKEHPGEQAMP